MTDKFDLLRTNVSKKIDYIDYIKNIQKRKTSNISYDYIEIYFICLIDKILQLYTETITNTQIKITYVTKRFDELTPITYDELNKKIAICRNNKINKSFKDNYTDFIQITKNFSKLYKSLYQNQISSYILDIPKCHPLSLSFSRWSLTCDPTIVIFLSNLDKIRRNEVEYESNRFIIDEYQKSLDKSLENISPLNKAYFNKQNNIQVSDLRIKMLTDIPPVMDNLYKKFVFQSKNLYVYNRIYKNVTSHKMTYKSIILKINDLFTELNSNNDKLIFADVDSIINNYKTKLLKFCNDLIPLLNDLDDKINETEQKIPDDENDEPIEPIESEYKNKYLKYKQKYLKLKNGF